MSKHFTSRSPRFIDLHGRKFGRWTVVGLAGRKNGHVMWACVCECGKSGNVTSQSLRTGQSKSCGCWHYEELAAMVKTHGMTKTPEHRTWCRIIGRCECPTNSSYPDYGGRGIRICDRWRESFEAFLADMGECPPGHSIERKNNDGDYTPENCVWATPKEQARNRRSSRFITIGHETLTLAEWCERYQQPVRMVHRRLNRGWDVVRALTVPPRKIRRVAVGITRR